MKIHPRAKCFIVCDTDNNNTTEPCHLISSRKVFFAVYLRQRHSTTFIALNSEWKLKQDLLLSSYLRAFALAKRAKYSGLVLIDSSPLSIAHWMSTSTSAPRFSCSNTADRDQNANANVNPPSYRKSLPAENQKSKSRFKRRKKTEKKNQIWIDTAGGCMRRHVARATAYLWSVLSIRPVLKV